MKSSLESTFQQLTHLLGGSRALGGPLRSSRDLVELIRKGVPASAVGEIRKQAGLASDQEVSELLHLSRTTLARKKKAAGRLPPQDSERVVRAARLAVLAEDVLGSGEKAWRWLRKPNRALQGQRPYELLDTDVGAQQVESVLGRIQYGIVS